MTRPIPRAGEAFVDHDIAQAPFTVAWEITRACPLRCVHCRADAQHRRDPRELSFDEGRALIDDAAAIGTKVFVITGGDPLARPDVFELCAAAVASGMHTGFSPSVTPRLTADAMKRVLDTGVGTIHLSLDGATAAVHDGFRGVRGAFDRTLQAIDTVHDLGGRLQVGTTVSRRTVDDLEAIVPLIAGRVDLWSLFFCVPTGRADFDDVLDAEHHERVWRWMATTQFPFAVRAIAAPPLRRVQEQLGAAAGRPGPGGISINDGKGFAFVSHVGEVCPSGFLQLPAGNVRQTPMSALYRSHDLFIGLRDPDRLGGKCGACEYRSRCGGSRARAYGFTGDPFAADPTCGYQPAA